MGRVRGLTAVGRRTEKVVGEWGRMSTSQSKNRNGCENTTVARRKDRLTQTYKRCIANRQRLAHELRFTDTCSADTH